MSDHNEDVIIIKKKKVMGGGHHGGAWKVAYADFVTAMMSLFMVMWLMSSSEPVKKSVAGYFNDPKGTAKLEGSSDVGVGQALPVSRADMATLKERLMASAKQLPNFDELKKQVEISASPDGLRIELMEEQGGTFFESGSAEPTPALREFLTLISKELGKMPNRISIEGHTDSRPYSGAGGYSNWELSADRANAARRLMQGAGIGAHQIAQVRGFADQMPRKPAAPEDASNRRITVIVDAAPMAEPVTGPEQVASEGGENKPVAGEENKSAKDKEVPPEKDGTKQLAAAKPAAAAGAEAKVQPGKVETKTVAAASPGLMGRAVAMVHSLTHKKSEAPAPGAIAEVKAEAKE